jgi:hypothetical protein
MNGVGEEKKRTKKKKINKKIYKQHPWLYYFEPV